jgi:hypothetical protein
MPAELVDTLPGGTPAAGCVDAATTRYGSKTHSFPPSSRRSSVATVPVLSMEPSRTLTMSRIPRGDVGRTIGEISHLGPKTTRVTGPPASRSVSVPV